MKFNAIFLFILVTASIVCAQNNPPLPPPCSGMPGDILCPKGNQYPYRPVVPVSKSNSAPVPTAKPYPEPAEIPSPVPQPTVLPPLPAAPVSNVEPIQPQHAPISRAPVQNSNDGVQSAVASGTFLTIVAIRKMIQHHKQKVAEVKPIAETPAPYANEMPANVKEAVETCQANMSIASTCPDLIQSAKNAGYIK